MISNNINIVFMGMESRFSKIPLSNILMNFEVCLIIESAPRNYNNNLKNKLKKKVHDIISNFRFFLTKDVTKLTLKEIAKKNKIPYYFCEDINSLKSKTYLQALNPQLICISSFSQIIKKEIIDIPIYGMINFHPSYLPYYKGPNPWFWQYYYMEKEGGVTIHFVDEGEDSGEIIFQQKYPIKLGIVSEEMWDIAISIGTNLLIKAIDGIIKKKIDSKKQEIILNNPRARNIKHDEKIIDWKEWKIERIFHVLRGTSTWLNSIGGVSSIKKLSILGFEKCIVPVEAVLGVRYKGKGKEWVYCHEGIIFIKTEFSLMKMIQKLI